MKYDAGSASVRYTPDIKGMKQAVEQLKRDIAQAKEAAEKKKKQGT